MNELTIEQVFPVDCVNDGSININGRQLWEYLGKEMSNYERDINKAINKAELVENLDYICVRQNDERNPKPTTVYYFTADAGKDIAMMANTKMGKDIRAYFKKCESTIRSLATMSKSDMYLELAKIEKQKEQLQSERDEAIRTKSYISDKKTATAMATASQAKQKLNKLQIRLDESNEYSTIRKQAIKHKEKYDYRLLSKKSKELNVEIKKAEDELYGEVNSYSKIVWLEVYNIDISK